MVWRIPRYPATVLGRDSQCQAVSLHEEASTLGIGAYGVDPLPLHRQGDRTLVRAFLRRPGYFLTYHPGPSHNGEDQVPSRIGKDYPVRPAQESLKY